MIENLALAFQGVWAHKMRSFLTILGIIIGIASIITIVSTMKGTSEQIKENLIGSGTNAVTVQLNQGSWPYRDWDYSGIPEGVSPITQETVDALREIDSVEEVALFSVREYNSNVYYQDTSYSDSLYGVDEHYFSAVGYTLCYGRDFVAEDFSEFRKVAVLDKSACDSLFVGINPIGKTLEIQGEAYTVVGVVEKAQSTALPIENINDYYTYVVRNSSGGIFVPLSTWPVIYMFDEPQSVVLRANSTDAMTRVGQQAEKILTASQIAGGSGIDAAEDTGEDGAESIDSGNYSYKSENLMEQAEKLQSMSNATNKQLLWIAAISLLVGGIGVMNIMLVTVTERTREIGLKKAVGARKRRILWQFLTEAASLTFIGGILGVVSGIILSKVISLVSGTPSAISIPASAVAVLFSMLIGILFGMLPAVKAANLNPIEALRRE